MESDVPLVEIAKEDDSLLHWIPGDTVSSSDTNKSTNDDTYFFCSPLQPLGSKPSEGVMRNEKSRKLSSSPLSRHNRDNIINKENTDTNANKIEEQKLSLQPQPMKRKMKGGGYNLRKSLAWDRAFFTDEGVLNSEELSMISRNANSNGLLSVIEEDTDCITGSADLEAIEEKLFKVLPENPSCKDRIAGGSSLPKHGSSTRENATPGSVARGKVLAACDISRSGSKRSGCPRPVAYSSLKRPANVNTMKSPTKEPKVSRLQLDPCLLSRTSKNVAVGANDLKRNQIVHPAAKLNTTKTATNNAKVAPTGKSLTSKSSVRQARRNVASLVKGSPTQIPCPLTIGANNGLEMTSKRALPSTGYPSYGRGDRSTKTAVPQLVSKQALPSPGHASYGRNDRSRNTAVPKVISKQALPSTCHPSSGCDDRSRKSAVPLLHIGVNLQHTQLPTSKPSGLRMPSPSLSFFHQPKASSLLILKTSPLKTSSQPCIIPNLRKVGSVDPLHESRPPSSLGKKQNLINDGKILGDINVQCSSSGCSVSSTANAFTKDKVEPFLQVTNMQTLEVNVQSSSNSYDVTENQQMFNSISVHKDQNSLGQAEPYITEKVFHMVEVEFQRKDDKSLLQSRSCEQVDKDDNSTKVALVLTPRSKDTDTPHVTSHLSSAAKFPGSSGKNDTTDHQILEDKPHDLPQKNYDVFLKSNSEDASSSSSISISYDGQSSCDHNVNELHGEQGDLFKPLTCEEDHISDEDQMLCENTGSFTKDSQASEEIQSYSCVKVAYVSPKVQNSSASELKRSDVLSDSRFEDQAKDDGSTYDAVNSNPPVGDAHMLALGGRLTDATNDVDLSTSAPDNCQLMIIDCGNEKPEQLELLSSRYIGDQAFPENRLHLNDCVLDGFSIFSEESQQKNALPCVDSKEPEGTGACRSEAEVSRTLSLIPPSMLDCRSNLVEIVESQNVDNIASVSEDKKTLVKNYNLHCQDSSLELGSMDGVQTTDAVTFNNIYASKSGNFTSQITRNFQGEVVSEIRGVFEQNVDNIALVSEDKKALVSIQLHCQDSSLQLESLDEVQITDAVSADNINASSLKSGDFTSQITLNVQVEGGSEIKDVIEPNNLGTKDKNLFGESCCHVPQLQTEDDQRFCEQDTSVQQINLTSDKINYSGEEINAMSGEINAGKRNVEQAKLVMSCFDVEDRMLNQISEAQGSTFEGRESFEEFHAYENGKCVDISSKVEASGGTGLRSSCGLSEHKSLDEANKEVDGGSDMIKESFPVDPPQQSSVANSAYSTIVNNVFELSGCPELQYPNIGVLQASQDNNPRCCLNGTLLANCKEFEGTVQEVVLDDYDACESASKSSEVAPAMHNGRSDLEDKADYLQMEVSATSSVKIGPSSENLQCSMKSCHDNKLSNQTASMEYDSSEKTTNEENTVSTLHPTEDKEAKKELTKPGSERKQDALVIKPPSDVVPFSDEWLAAFEAAGEEILTKKSGAVQNSPLNKSQPQLGPWSPVKRKTNQVIGPFDCTKHTNHPPTSQ